MAVQLILYPQWYEGGYSAIGTVYTQYIADGICFMDLQSSVNTIDPLATGTNQPEIPRIFEISTPLAPGVLSQPAINQFVDIDVTMGGPMVPNAWYSTFSDNASYQPTVQNQTQLGCKQALIAPGETGEYCSIIQKLSGLTAGSTYDIYVDLEYSGSSSGIISVFAYRQFDSLGNFINNPSTTMFLTQSMSATPLSYQKSFTAQGTDDILEFWVYAQAGAGANTHFVDITNIQIEETGIVPSVIPTVNILGDGQVILDLYENENIPLTLSVDNFKNIAEKVQSYSKSFNIPGTKRNNQILDYLFEITRADTGVNFNAYKKTQCVLKEDGIILFEGYMKINDITIKEEEISYSINLYSEVIALADVLKDRKFSHLSFKELEHEYQKTQTVGMIQVQG